MMSFKDKKPNIIPEGYYYNAADMDKYLAIVEPKAENWEKYEGLGFLPVELFTRLVRFFDELRGYAAKNTQMQIKAEGFYNKLIVIENPLKMYEKLEAVKNWRRIYSGTKMMIQSYWDDLGKILEAS